MTFAQKRKVVLANRMVKDAINSEFASGLDAFLRLAFCLALPFLIMAGSAS